MPPKRFVKSRSTAQSGSKMKKMTNGGKRVGRKGGRRTQRQTANVQNKCEQLTNVSAFDPNENARSVSSCRLISTTSHTDILCSSTWTQRLTSRRSSPQPHTTCRHTCRCKRLTSSSTWPQCAHLLPMESICFKVLPTRIYV
jgi:hypothetical protein